MSHEEWTEFEASRMTSAYIKPSGAIRHMTISSAKVVLLLALLVHGSCAAGGVSGGVSGCCSRRPRACGLYGLLCRAGSENDTDVKPMRVSSDAAAGILTLGKRRTTETRYQDRLQNLLLGSRNQAAGILTMGRRSEEGGARAPARPSGPALGLIHTPVKLDLERPVEYLIQSAARDSYGR